MSELITRRPCFGATIYVRDNRSIGDETLFYVLRKMVPSLLQIDPDNYRTVREVVFETALMTYVVAVGQRVDGEIWYAVLVVGDDRLPPPDYVEAARAVGLCAAASTADAGDFDD